MADLLESTLREPFTKWKKAPPSQTANAEVLKALHPTIEGAIRTHIGEPNQFLTSRAKLMTLEGLQSYDPSKGKLQTHLYNHLQGLRRVNRKQTSILQVPERVAIGRHQLETVEDELRATLGREPTDEEVSNESGFSPRQFAKIRSYDPAVAEGTMEAQPHGLMGGVQDAGAERNNLWRDVVYDELDDHHKKVMEHALGMNGRRQLSGGEIAQKMRRSPGAISQAKARIQQKLDDAYAASQLI